MKQRPTWKEIGEQVGLSSTACFYLWTGERTARPRNAGKSALIREIIAARGKPRQRARSARRGTMKWNELTAAVRKRGYSICGALEAWLEATA